jgi:phage shock protein PspC (stress-responsive transcriptional regulator)
MTRRSRTWGLPSRSPEGRILAGVCAGIAGSFEIDVTLVRLAFLVLVFAWGLGLVLYVALWLTMPEHGHSSVGLSMRATLRHRARGMQRDLGDWRRVFAARWHRVGRDPWPRPIGRRWMALTLLAAGATFLLTSIGAFSWITPVRAASLAMIVVGIGALISMRNADG